MNDKVYDQKATNPKDAIGCKKLPMHLVPKTAMAYLALAMTEGALKYGKYNWRVAGVRSSIYLDAVERHLAKLTDGEWADNVTGVPHLASIMACCAITLDAKEVHKLNDDRPPVAHTSELIDTLAHHVTHLQQLFANCNPHQNTILDALPALTPAPKCDKHTDCSLSPGHDGKCWGSPPATELEPPDVKAHTRGPRKAARKKAAKHVRRVLPHARKKRYGEARA